MSDNKLEIRAIKRDLQCCLTALETIKTIVKDMSKYIEQNIDSANKLLEKLDTTP